MERTQFRQELAAKIGTFKQAVADDTGEWVIKGFIDVYRNIYTISVDTKVVSKIVELLLFPLLARFADEHGYTIALAEHQNFYPDITFIDRDGTMVALDVKSTYRTGPNTVNGFTLGAFTGYFRQRSSTKNVIFPYNKYIAHFVLGILYSRDESRVNERQSYNLEELQDIVSVARNFDFLVHEKWRLAGDQPGSGNTKNIGSVKSAAALLEGKGLFADLGEEVFDDYWQCYLTNDMARRIDSTVPYHNLREYLLWRGRPPASIASATALTDIEPIDDALSESAQLSDDDKQNI